VSFGAKTRVEIQRYLAWASQCLAETRVTTVRAEAV
jgi:hypothetical protein